MSLKLLAIQNKFVRCLVCIVLLTLLGSCSSVQVSYRFLDDLMRWELNKYVSLSGQPSRDLDEALGVFHDWHRVEQLGLY